jgi:hypothetical protein
MRRKKKFSIPRKKKRHKTTAKNRGGGEEKITIESTWLNVFSSTGHVEYTALFSARVIHAN